MPLEPDSRYNSLTMKADPISNRVFGLDLLRSLAIISVVFAHTLYLFKDFFPWAFRFHLWSAFIGVEMFFVLSGFLIGRILLRSFDESPGVKTLFGFWLRRWFRTLPNYYLFLIIYIFLYPAPGGHYPDLMSFVFFFQNFASWRLDGLFEISWSLAVEEWFYLLFPAVLLICRKTFRNRREGSLSLSSCF